MAGGRVMKVDSSGVAEGAADLHGLPAGYTKPYQGTPQLPALYAATALETPRAQPVQLLHTDPPAQPSVLPREEVPPLTQHAPRKVALLVEPTPFTHVSGYSNRFQEMLRYLKEGGDTTEVITPDDSKERPKNFLGVPIHYIPGFRFLFYRQIQLTWDFGSKARPLLERFRPDVIHCSAPGMFMVAAVAYAKALSVPLVISYHTDVFTYVRRYILAPFRPLWRWGMRTVLRTTLNQADLVLATSPQLAEQIEGWGVKNVAVWRKGVDTEVFSPKWNEDNSAMRERLTAGEPHRPLLLYVGRLGAEKNVELVKGVLEKIPNARFAVVGQGPNEEWLKKEFAGTDTVFTGLLKGEDLSRAFAAADVFVMPSDSETLGFVVLEAMASGVPVVAARAGGIPSIVTDGVNGLLHTPGDAADMAAGVQRLLDDKRLHKRLMKEGRADALKWDWRAATSVLRNVQYTAAERNFKLKMEEQDRKRSDRRRLLRLLTFGLLGRESAVPATP